MGKIEKLGIILMLFAILLSLAFDDWPFVFLFAAGAYIFYTDLDLFPDQDVHLSTRKRVDGSDYD